jgi:hypothetical protein
MNPDPMTSRPIPSPQKGKILRVRQGFNPNSSSLGTVVFSFKAAMLALPVLFSTAGAIIMARAEARAAKSDSHENADSSPAPSLTEVANED